MSLCDWFNTSFFLIRLPALCFLTACLSGQVVAHGLSQNHLEALSHQIDHSPQTSALYLERGRAFYYQQQWPQAIEDFKRAYQLEPNLYDSLYELGRTYFASGESVLAMKALKEYLRCRPNNALGHGLIAKVLTARHQFQRAVEHFDLAISNDPKPTPQLFLERFRAAEQVTPMNPLQMQRGLEQGLRRLGNTVTIMALIVELQCKIKNYDLARAWLQKYPEALQATPGWGLQLADIFLAQNNILAAHGAYNDVLLKITSMPINKRVLPAIAAQELRAKQGVRQTALLPTAHCSNATDFCEVANAQ